MVFQIGHFRHFRHFGYQENAKVLKLDHLNQGSDLGEHGIQYLKIFEITTQVELKATTNGEDEDFWLVLVLIGF